MFKKIVFIIVTILCFSFLVFGGAFIERFTAKSESGNVVLEWNTKEESNVKSFEVERKSGNADNFITIGSINPTGNNSNYQFIDKSAYKTTDAIYMYRIKIVDNNPSVPFTYTSQLSVTHKTSGVKSTWGSIKSMFRL